MIHMTDNEMGFLLIGLLWGMFIMYMYNVFKNYKD